MFATDKQRRKRHNVDQALEITQLFSYLKSSFPELTSLEATERFIKRTQREKKFALKV